MSLPNQRRVFNPATLAMVAGLGTLLMALPARGVDLIIDSLVPAPAGYTLDASDSLTITTTGVLSAIGQSVVMNGSYLSVGQLLAKTLSGNGNAINQTPGLIQAETIFSDRWIFNSGTVKTGGFVSVPVVSGPASNQALGGYFATGNSALINNNGDWFNHGNMSLRANSGAVASFENRGYFASVNSTFLSPYSQTITLEPVPGNQASGQPAIFNVSLMFLGRGTTLMNRGLILNSGNFVVGGGAKLEGDNSFWRSNRQSGVFHNVSTGTLTINRFGSFSQNSSESDFGSQGPGGLNNFGLILVNGEVRTNGPVRSQAGGRIEIGATGDWGFDGSFINAVGSSVLVDGKMFGSLGGISNSGNFEVTGTGRVDVGSVSHSAGKLTVNGELTASLTMTGGILDGSGRINGDVFIGGIGAPALPFATCSGLLISATPCFNPGNSPGHMEINGALTLGSGAILELELERAADGSLAWDSVTAASMSFEAGSLVRVLISDAAGGQFLSLPQFSFLTCTNTSACNFGGATLVVQGAFDAPNYHGGELVFSDSGLSFSLAPVPEPQAWALMLCGLGLVGWLARKRQNLA